MAKKVNKTDLGFMGKDFQLRLVKCLIEDFIFFERIVNSMDANMFTDEILRRIVGIMQERYLKTYKPITYPDIDIVARGTISDAISLETLEETLEEIKNFKFDDFEYVEEKAEQFFTQQKLVSALNQGAKIIERGNASEYSKIISLYYEALNVTIKPDDVHHLFENLEEDFSEDYRVAISTGVKELDEALGGGLAKGELGVIIAPSNVGKTSLCVGFGAAAALHKTELNNHEGWKVLHYFFEDKPVDIRRKYDAYYLSCFNGYEDVDAIHLSMSNRKETYFNKLQETSDSRDLLCKNIQFERLINGECSVDDIALKIQRQVALGFRPDLVIVDYFDCLKLDKRESSDSEWAMEGNTMRKLEALCNKLDIALWLPIQSTKGAIGEERVGLKDGGGSVKKIQVAHVVITLARTAEMKSQGLINLFIEKLRSVKFGRDRFYNAKFNNGTCRLDLSPCDDVDGLELDDIS